jgi:hypothetical protein
MFLPAFDFGTLAQEKFYRLKQLSVPAETSDGKQFHLNIEMDGVEYKMFLNKKNENHQYLYNELTRPWAGEGYEFFFIKLPTINGDVYRVSRMYSDNGEALDEPDTEKLYKEIINDKSMTATERAIFSAVAIMCTKTGVRSISDFRVLYIELLRLLPHNSKLSQDQRNMLFCAASISTTINEMVDNYNHLCSEFL